MNQEHRFELVDTGLLPTLPSPSEPEPFAARARQQRADAAEAMIASASRSVTEALRSLLTLAVRWQQQRATRDALMRCSDRVLADIGIEREHIPLVAKGVDPAEYELLDSASRPWWVAARARLAAALEARRERLRATASSTPTPIASSTRSGCGAPTSLSSRASTRSCVGRPDPGRRPSTRWRPPPTRSPAPIA